MWERHSCRDHRGRNAAPTPSHIQCTPEKSQYPQIHRQYDQGSMIVPASNLMVISASMSFALLKGPFPPDQDRPMPGAAWFTISVLPSLTRVTALFGWLFGVVRRSCLCMVYLVSSLRFLK